MEGNAEEKSKFALEEEKVLNFWNKNQIFEKTLRKDSPRGDFVFYDGPPFATGLPHYGHILAGTMKDVVPRYKTMRGFHVDRRWGWDCHGVPIERLVQEENNLRTKKDIENFGIKNFSKAAKDSVFRYDKEWKEIVPRTGRWVDMENQYTTMSPDFMESVWWAFKKLQEKGLVYEDFKSVHISPPLETSLSNFEVNSNYKDITDISVYVKFALEGEENTYLLAWTTTPWTLFGNVALAVGSDIDYVKVKVENDILILAKSRLVASLKNKTYEEIGILKGSDLVGRKYRPLFDYYSKREDLLNRENGWKIYAADFVTTEDGTGIVHIAPAFGEDDLTLGQKNKLPFVQHVNIDGSIKSDIPEFAGLQAKPKDDPTSTDVLVLKRLAVDGALFEKEKIVHSYPHCWRTDAPLLNYALSSWFIKVTDYNQKMVSLNKKVHWVPQNVGEKRFGNWLENVKDWGVSRSRYWGTPMPIWKSEDGKELEFLGSVQDIKDRTKSSNSFYLMRHGEAEHNVGRFLNSDNSNPVHLTENGKKQVLNGAKRFSGKKIDFVYCSPLIRARETADILMKNLNISSDKLIIDDRLIETQSGVLNGKTFEEYSSFFKDVLDKFYKKPDGGETIVDIRKRVGSFIYEINKKHDGKNILIISHEYPIWMLMSLNKGLSNEAAAKIKEANVDFVPTGDIAEYNFAPIPHDDDYVLDLHRPYIDEITFTKNGKLMKRIPDVFDCWFESGSVPFAVPHYPFEKNMEPAVGLLGLFKKRRRFPADFIAEGLDQTRGWFYTLLALNTALFGKSPYKNVIVNGLVLAEDGQKMSKRLNNYPEPVSVFNKFGADSVRYYMLSSGIVQAEPLNFSEKGVDEVYKKIILRLLNVLAFYDLYAAPVAPLSVAPESGNILDRWITARLNQVLEETTAAMESYELNVASRTFFDFVDDLSTWYIRRSRDRFKEDWDETDRQSAVATTGLVLNEFAKIIAPFMPFTAEMIYQKVNGLDFSDENRSVHLESWSKPNKTDLELLEKMSLTRELVSVSLLERDKFGIKVRQPLRTLKINIGSEELGDDFVELIKDEVNIKQILCDKTLGEAKVQLDVTIDEELKQEGVVRDLGRFIQNLRKEKGLAPMENIALEIETDSAGEKLIRKFESEISRLVRSTETNFRQNDGAILKVGELSFKISII
ncbi:MAG TPA: class I tRNA ligase family protein [Candidatus Paceibacterota bacterium]|nr:class I tRNA ligase family protein [Candidatus Paceibacterota bacterium]HRZ34180.1 class I tRNA ligase family protein [Candidatus Paceibacterota bacterium]